MIKKLFIIVCLTLFATNSFSAGSDPKPAKVKQIMQKQLSQ